MRYSNMHSQMLVGYNEQLEEALVDKFEATVDGCPSLNKFSIQFACLLGFTGDVSRNARLCAL